MLCVRPLMRSLQALAHGTHGQLTPSCGMQVAGIVPRLAAAACGAELDATAQLLANFAAGGGRGACAALWEALRPAALARLAAVRRHGTQVLPCRLRFPCDPARRASDL